MQHHSRIFSLSVSTWQSQGRPLHDFSGHCYGLIGGYHSCSRHTRRSCPAPARASSSKTSSKDNDSEQRRTVEQYIGTDGRRKVTLEETFRQGRYSSVDGRMPWQFSWQRNEKALSFGDETRAHMVKVGMQRM